MRRRLHKVKSRRRLRPGSHLIHLRPRELSSPADGPPLLRFAVYSDTHYWVRSSTRSAWMRRVAAAPVRDGLVVDAAEEVLPLLLRQLSAFAASGADFAVHAGDAVCGGSSFQQEGGEFETTLRLYRSLEASVLGTSWPVYHLPGNHDIHPSGGGTRAWRKAMCANASRECNAAQPWGHACDATVHARTIYRAVCARAWRVLLLDATDGIDSDSDGRGHIGATQLGWLRAQLDASAAARQSVILVMHQLLVQPPGDGWVDPTQDFIDNREEVLALLARYDHVRLSLHGHVHANSIATRGGVVFVTTASAAEYPMHWREVSVYECEVRLTTHAVDAPLQRVRSRDADPRLGRNDIKLGPSLANYVVINTCANSRHRH